MNLPKRATCLMNLLGMLLVEHQPAANSYRRRCADQLSESRCGPFGMLFVDARRDLDDDGSTAIIELGVRHAPRWGAHQPDMEVAPVSCGLAAVRGLRIFQSYA